MRRKGRKNPSKLSAEENFTFEKENWFNYFLQVNIISELLMWLTLFLALLKSTNSIWLRDSPREVNFTACYFLIPWNLQAINLIKWTIILLFWDLNERTDQFLPCPSILQRKLLQNFELKAATWLGHSRVIVRKTTMNTCHGDILPGMVVGILYCLN